MKFLLVVAVLAAVAWYYLKPLPPGQGPNAQIGMRASVPILQSIEAFRNARGVYPLTLDDVVPEFLNGVPHLPNGSTFEYQRLGVSYALTFNYSNPLPVHCSYDGTKKWKCEWF
jgi:hypothetical protein